MCPSQAVGVWEDGGLAAGLLTLKPGAHLSQDPQRKEAHPFGWGQREVTNPISYLPGHMTQLSVLSSINVESSDFVNNVDFGEFLLSVEGQNSEVI